MDPQLNSASRLIRGWCGMALFLGLLTAPFTFPPAMAQTPAKESLGGLAKPVQPLSAPNGAQDLPQGQSNNDVFKTASQEQLRACAFQWREMKRSGKASGKIWRDFARSCLAGL